MNNEYGEFEFLKYEERGHAKHGWLDSKHSFSFAQYHNPFQMGFSDLRVINDDWIDGGYGFSKHPHNNMEIFTYVLEGALEHKDSMENGEVINPGDVQMMSAGTGVFHSEFNPLPNTKTNLLQIWLYPNVKDENPTYQQQSFKSEDKRGKLKLIVSQDQRNGSLKIKQNASIYAGLFDGDEQATLPVNEDRSYFVHVVKGDVKINDIPLKGGDAMKIFKAMKDIKISNGKNAEILIFDLNKH